MNWLQRLKAQTPTKGPWFCDDKQDGDRFRNVMAGSGDDCVVICRTCIDANPHAEADAQLIASAPDLFAALREIHTLRPRGIGATEYSLTVEAIARAAMAKATGVTR